MGKSSHYLSFSAYLRSKVSRLYLLQYVNLCLTDITAETKGTAGIFLREYRLPFIHVCGFLGESARSGDPLEVMLDVYLPILLSKNQLHGTCVSRHILGPPKLLRLRRSSSIGCFRRFRGRSAFGYNKFYSALSFYFRHSMR